MELGGQQILHWDVLYSEQITKNERLWLCVCICGHEQLKPSSSLKNLTKLKCDECGRSETRVGTMPAQYWSQIQYNARKRSIQVLVTAKEAFEILEKQDFKCALTGESIGFAAKGSSHTASLDRIDSGKHYENGNLQWLHKDVNIMKLDYSQERFVEVAQGIASQMILPD